MAENINIASLIISVIILIVVVILIFMVCYYYSTNNNSTKSIQNPQALAAAALYKNANKNANKDNFGCPLSCCCVYQDNGEYVQGICGWGGSCINKGTFKCKTC